MKTYLLLLSAIFLSAYAHTQPLDSINAYLQRTPPDTIPEIFDFGSMLKETHYSSRVLFSKNGRELYYASRNPHTVRINLLKYENDTWNDLGPVFEGYFAPAFSADEDTIFFHTTMTGHRLYFSTRVDEKWSEPQQFHSERLYYYQQTSLGNAYAGRSNGEFGGSDIYQVHRAEQGFTYTNLNSPINTSNNDEDFFMARDESYIIYGANEAPDFGGRDLYISFKDEAGNWTVPQSLGAQINDGPVNKWAPYVTHDGKYLFYTKLDNPSWRTYWVRFDAIYEKLTSIAKGSLSNGYSQPKNMK